MRTLLVVGVGLLGARVAREAAERGWRVAAADRDPAALDAVRPWAASGTAEVDVTDTEGVRRAAGRFAPHTVVHTASRIDVPTGPGDPADRLREYGRGVAAVAGAAVTHGAHRLVLVSSLAVYDLAGAREPVPESAPPGPRSLYGRGKLVEELLAARLLHGTDTRLSVLRPVGLYGPGPGGGRLHRRLADLCARARSGAEVRVDGYFHGREYLHVSDAARAVVSAAGPGRPDGVFNLATGRITTGEDIAAAVRAAGFRATAGPPPGAAPLLDTSRAERFLEFRARVGVADGIAELLGRPRTAGSAC
ncbi:NAD-dependent epimerase/dehydratase family protein [Streptomyces sp. NPDC001668]|uniref:NAD-dependent epimerase/dehydratase family protein n=1 Tax=unclassified Streptomyces TaxID=2593676 RepID=UPI0036C2E1D0